MKLKEQLCWEEGTHFIIVSFYEKSNPLLLLLLLSSLTRMLNNNIFCFH